MENIPSFIYSKQQTIAFMLVLAVLISSCDRAAQTDVAAASDLLLQRIDSETKSATSNTTAQTVYSYDDGKNLVRKTYNQSTKQSSIAAETTFSVTTDNTYNPDGYLLTSITRSVERTSGAGAAGIPPLIQRSSTTTYAYSAGKVASYTIVETRTDGQQATRTGTYAYDPATEQVRQTELSGNAFSRIYTYTKGILTDYVEQNGAVETRPWVLNKGVITRFTIPGGLVLNYQYDEQLRPIRMDEFLNGKLTNYYVWTNDAMKPGSEAVPIQKGFPILLQPFGREGVRTSDKSYYINALNGQIQLVNDHQTVNQANSEGFVKSRTSTARPQDPLALPQVATTTETYTYNK